jgi:acyl carrier protein
MRRHCHLASTLVKTADFNHKDVLFSWRAAASPVGMAPGTRHAALAALPGRALQQDCKYMSDTVPEISALIIQTLLANPKVPRSIDGSSKIVEDLAFDSLAVMNFVMEIEDSLDVSVPLDRLADIRTIDDLAACIVSLKQGG